MRRLIPSKKVCEEFLLTYEMKGCQKALNLLSEYYGIRRMKNVVEGRRVGNGDEACYDTYIACVPAIRTKRQCLSSIYFRL